MFSAVTAWSSRRPTSFGSLALACALALMPLACAVHAASVAGPGQAPAREDASIRPFHIHVPEARLADLRKRIADTRWPDKEPVGDTTQGVQLATLQALLTYWGNGYDWRKVEVRLNALPDFVTTIDGVRRHLLRRSRRGRAAVA